MSRSAAADGNLLFGILALQMDFISRDQLANLKKANEATQLAFLKLDKEQKETEFARAKAVKAAKLAKDRADEIEDNLATSTMQLARAPVSLCLQVICYLLLRQRTSQAPPRRLRNPPFKIS